ncbi:MAG: PASTA domain-containing protein, partial [Gemmatimonadaceae bacterium]
GIDDPGGNLDKAEEDEGGRSYVLDISAPHGTAPTSITPRPIPDVHRLSLREAVAGLHRAGFQVRIIEGAPASIPAAGTIAAPGTIVQLIRPRE